MPKQEKYKYCLRIFDKQGKKRYFVYIEIEKNLIDMCLGFGEDTKNRFIKREIDLCRQKIYEEIIKDGIQNEFYIVKGMPEHYKVSKPKLIIIY